MVAMIDHVTGVFLSRKQPWVEDKWILLDDQMDACEFRVRRIDKKIIFCWFDIGRNPQPKAFAVSQPLLPIVCVAASFARQSFGNPKPCASRIFEEESNSRRIKAISLGLAPLQCTLFSSWHKALVDPA